MFALDGADDVVSGAWHVGVGGGGSGWLDSCLQLIQ